MQLYSYFRSSAAYRVRIALNLKGLPYEYLPVHLLKDGGQQLSADYRKVNPTALVPTLVDGDAVIGQSLAIIEYLEETHPEVPLLPADAVGRARVRDLALGIACDTHPLNNLRVLKYLKHTLGVDEAAKTAWYKHWVHQAWKPWSATGGFFRHRPLLPRDTPTIADLCLVPQVANAQRFDCDLSAMPNVVRIDAACRALPAFDAAAPGKQPDAE